MTRWQGTMIDTGFLPFAAPTARVAARVPELFRKLSIASRLSKRYGKQGFPHIFLKTSTSHIESDGERFSFPGEVFT